MVAVPKVRMSYADYLAAEGASDVKHEFIGGEVFAMAGGTREHSRLSVNMVSELRKALVGRPCVVFNSDARVRVRATNRSTYPDASVVCGALEPSPEDPEAIVNPIVIVEVLSDSTGADDRGEKFAHYRRIPSLCEYVLVSQRAPRVEVYRREGDFWALTEAGPGQSARLASLDITLSVDDLYANPLA